MRAIFLNSGGKDMFPIHELENIVFEDVAPEAMMEFFDPPAKWSGHQDCGEFPCTGPWNTVFRFVGTSYVGDVDPGLPGADFSLIPDTPNYSEHLTGCEFKENWNAWACDNLQLGMLLFESEDSDRLDRSVQPVYVRDYIDDGTATGTYTMNNKLNSMAN